MLLPAASPGPSLRRLITVVLVPLAAAGSMTLTLYTAHIMFINSELDTYERHDRIPRAGRRRIADRARLVEPRPAAVRWRGLVAAVAARARRLATGTRTAYRRRSTPTSTVRTLPVGAVPMGAPGSGGGRGCGPTMPPASGEPHRRQRRRQRRRRGRSLPARRGR